MDILRAGVSAALQPFNNVPSLRHFIQLPLALTSLLPSQQIPVLPSQPLNELQTCLNPSLSCPSTLPSPIDTCCLNHPSGHFLLAQFWDTSPPAGPNNSWTLHGLWPDYCTGGFPANCDRARELSASTISSIVDEASKSTHPGLRTYMDTFWKGLHGDDDLWMHEWNKHGTCVSTLEPSCYGGFDSTSSATSMHSDLLDYFTAATTLHASLHSYSVLEAHNIVPSTTETYSLSAIQDALASAHAGFTSTVKCNSHGELNEIWTHFTVRGPLRNSSAVTTPEQFVPVAPDGLVAKCPKEGIKYLPKDKSHDGHPPSHGRPRPTATYHPPRPTGLPFEGRGHLKIRVLSDPSSPSTHQSPNEGCLIRQGQWYTSGQCATYRTKTDVNNDDPDEAHLFTLASSYAPCAILEQDGPHGAKGEFVCANRLPVQSIFGSESVTTEGADREVLTWKEQSVFYAKHTPGRFEKVNVFADDGGGERMVKLEIGWESA